MFHSKPRGFWTVQTWTLQTLTLSDDELSRKQGRSLTRVSLGAHERAEILRLQGLSLEPVPRVLCPQGLCLRVVPRALPLLLTGCTLQLALGKSSWLVRVTH